MSDIEPTEDLSQILRHRREKLEEVVKRGMQPFAYNYSATSSTIAAIEGFEAAEAGGTLDKEGYSCLLYTSPSPRDGLLSRMPSSA